jgi:WD40 repeat protein
MIFSLLQDFADALAAMPADHPRRRILALLDEAMRRDVHFIARHPTTLFQCLWNSCWWYDCPQRDQYQSPAPPPTGPQPGEPLYRILEQWRNAKDQRQPGHLWLRTVLPPRQPLGSAQKAILRGHGRAIECLAVSADGRWIASGGEDRRVLIWDAELGEQRRCLEGVYTQHSAAGQEITKVALSPTRPQMASGNKRGTLRSWDLDAGRELWSVQVSKYVDEDAEPVTGLAFSADGDKLYCTLSGPSIEVRTAASGQLAGSWRGPQQSISDLALGADGSLLVTASKTDHNAVVWEVAGRNEVCRLPPHADIVYAVAIAPDGRLVATATPNGAIRLWDVPAARLRRVLAGPRGLFRALLSFSPDGRYLASSTGRAIHVWDVERDQAINCLHGHEDDVRALAFLPPSRGACLVSGSQDRTVRIWDPFGPTLAAPTERYESQTTATAFSPDGRYLASGTRDGRITIWDPADCRPLRRLDLGRELSIYRLMFSHTGRHLYIQTWHDVRVWRTMTRCPVRVLRPRKKRANLEAAYSDLWWELRDKEMGRGWNADEALAGRQSRVPGIPLGPYTTSPSAEWGLETAILERRSRAAVAWYPLSFSEPPCHPSGRTWCLGSDCGRLFLLTLEGEQPAESASHGNAFR